MASLWSEDSSSPSDASLASLQLKKEPGEEFRESIQKMISHCEDNIKNEQSITKAIEQFHINRRRIYDVINVLEAVGCCQKTDLDKFLWKGTNNVIPTVTSLAKSHNIITTEPLYVLFPANQIVGLQNLTISFTLLFIAIGQNRLDIRTAGSFLSRQSDRSRTTLTKLYQIADILSTINMIERTCNVWEVILEKHFFDNILTELYTPVSLNCLLNRKRLNPMMEKRKKELNQYEVHNKKS